MAKLYGCSRCKKKVAKIYNVIGMRGAAFCENCANSIKGKRAIYPIKGSSVRREDD